MIPSLLPLFHLFKPLSCKALAKTLVSRSTASPDAWRPSAARLLAASSRSLGSPSEASTCSSGPRAVREPSEPREASEGQAKRL